MALNQKLCYFQVGWGERGRKKIANHSKIL